MMYPFPIRIQDLLFSAVKQNTVESCMGPIISIYLALYRKTFFSIDSKYQEFSPIWHNYALIMPGSKPCMHGDVFNHEGLLSFQDLMECYCLPGSLCFWFLILHSVQHLKCKEYLGMHSYPITLWQRITKLAKLVASVYIKLSSGDNKPLLVKKKLGKIFSVSQPGLELANSLEHHFILP